MCVSTMCESESTSHCERHTIISSKKRRRGEEEAEKEERRGRKSLKKSPANVCVFV